MKVKEFLSSPEKWCKGGEAKTREGRVVNQYSPEACSFCLLAALSKCYMYFGQKREAIQKIHNVLLPFGFDSLILFNDSPTTTYEMIKDVLEKADV